MVSQMPPSVNDSSQDLPGARCNRYVEPPGMMSSYPCRVEFGHDGPCACDEAPATVRKRAQWLAERENQRVATVLADHRPPANLLPPGVPIPPTILAAAELHDPHTRHLADLDRFSEGSLVWVNQAFSAHQCMVTLGLLYARCKREYARGADQVVITEAYLDALIPETAKSMFDQFAVARQEPQ